MTFHMNTLRRAAVGVTLTLTTLAAALAVPATAQAATYGPYWDLRQCSMAASAYGGAQNGAYCFLRNGRWYLHTP
ncbi:MULTISPECIES: hypothetical protein [Streptosporangium]|uniref:Uncharacterized protein n=1 Tax=Streptosporangium brasiliense TaxID=47480 RepID=A0ABT9R3X3_9ACTN|nr:hypothetical protein [Streptosporangium brasiliense]MDP9863150.1 hypothetical protein [Streptosporangium brasiliense]